LALFKASFSKGFTENGLIATNKAIMDWKYGTWILEGHCLKIKVPFCAFFLLTCQPAGQKLPAIWEGLEVSRKWTEEARGSEAEREAAREEEETFARMGG
jgi:hypothetical protein